MHRSTTLSADGDRNAPALLRADPFSAAAIAMLREPLSCAPTARQILRCKSSSSWIEPYAIEVGVGAQHAVDLAVAGIDSLAGVWGGEWCALLWRDA